MSVLLAVLKIIGLIILCLLVIILIPVIIILSSSLKYKIYAEKYERLKAEAKFSWFFRAVKLEIYAELSEDLKTILKKELSFKVFGRNISKKSKRPKKKNLDRKKEERQDIKKVEPEKTEKQKPDFSADKPLRLEDEEYKALETPKYMRIKMPYTKMPAQEEKPSEARKEPEEKTEEAEYEKREKSKIDIAYFKNMPKYERKRLISTVFKFIKSVLKTVFPRSFKLIGSFGISDPALTGEVLGGICILKGLTGLNINVSGDFRGENIFDGEVFVEGRIRFSALFFYTIRLVFSKPVFKIIKIYLKG